MDPWLTTITAQSQPCFSQTDFFEVSNTSTLRDATILEVPDCIRQDENAIQYLSHLENDPVLEVELTRLARGNDALECCFKIHLKLLTYAQSFERNKFFKKEMGLNDDGVLGVDGLDRQYHLYHDNPLQKPFKGAHTNPIEAALMLAWVASDLENIDDFKRQRAIVLYHLEYHYQQVSLAALFLNSFIKEEKRDDGLFDVHRAGGTYGYSSYDYIESSLKWRCETAVLLLRYYEAAFLRDLTADIRKEIGQNQRLFKVFYISTGIKPLLND
jgi:hypothetical protein